MIVESGRHPEARERLKNQEGRGNGCAMGERWGREDAAHYGQGRFQTRSGRRTHAREANGVARLLALAAKPGSRWLDVPCGTGRLSCLLPDAVCSDLSLSMLQLCPPHYARVRATALALPFADGAFDGVLCVRLLPHLAGPGERVRALSELARTSREWVLVSFFDALSLQHLRRSVRRFLFRRRPGRQAIGFGRFCAEAARAGLAIEAVLPARRFISEQWLVLLRRVPGSRPEPGRAPGSARPPEP